MNDMHAEPAARPEPCHVCGAPAVDQICYVNEMPAGVTVWVPVCESHA